jgi:hypothetical protein
MAGLDFGLAYIGSVANEFLWFFGDINNRLPGPNSIVAEERALRNASLHGFPDSPPSSASRIEWEAA